MSGNLTNDFFTNVSASTTEARKLYVADDPMALKCKV
jgi:hypothetical protein